MNVSCVILLAAISLPTSVAAQLASGPGEVDVPGEWRQLEASYRAKANRLQEERREKGEQLRSSEDRLRANDVSKASAQAIDQVQESRDKMITNAGKTVRDYILGRGGEAALEKGTKHAASSLKELAKIEKAKRDYLNEINEAYDLPGEISQLRRNLQDLNAEIEEALKEAEYADQVADLYEADTRGQATDFNSRLDSVIVLTDNIVLKVKEKRDYIPAGWDKCSCPDVHQAHGRIIYGHRYHGPGLECPP